jgi:thiol-disulfide isomerase/thioredoxin
MRLSCALLWLELLFAAAPALASSQSRGVVVDEPAPGFELKVLGGGTVSLAELRGKPVLLTFWATWCPPCRSEFPDILAIHEANQSAGLRVIAINLSDLERMKDVRKYVAEFQLPFPVLLDERGKTQKRYTLLALPTTVFVDTAGIVRALNPGPVSRQALDRGLATILPPP